MSRFAKDTSVPVERSKAEIENTVTRYGASGFMAGWLGQRAMVAFEMRGRRLRFLLPLPQRDDREFTHTPGKGLLRSEGDAYRSWEQACRQRWRALNLVIKAKLEAVESGVSVFDDEFLAYVVLPDNSTVGERMVPELQRTLESGRLPPLLPGPTN